MDKRIAGHLTLLSLCIGHVRAETLTAKMPSSVPGEGFGWHGSGAGASASNSFTERNISYEGNRLSSVNSATYSYDANGNITSDGRRGLTIEYNLLNLPSEVTGTVNGTTMTAYYKYLPDGTKLSTADNSGSGFAYLGSLVYRKNGSSYTFESTDFSGGRIYSDGIGYDVGYFVRDRLGSTRTIVDGSGNIVEQNDYYPFGGRLDNGLSMSATNRYRFSGKEQQTVADVDLLDFGARFYDDEICRWTSTDPLAYKYFGLSPYNYCGNDPVNRFDPDGRDVFEIDNEGRIVNRIKDNTQDMFYMVEDNDKGNYERTGPSLSFEYGTVKSVHSVSFSQPDGTKDTYDVYQVRGDENGSALFEFLAIGAREKGIEVSQAKCGYKGDKGLNFVTTGHTLPISRDGHQVSVEMSMSLLYNERLQSGYTIRELIHSHPSSPYASHEDNNFATAISNNARKMHHNDPDFYLWFVPKRTYIMY